MYKFGQLKSSDLNDATPFQSMIQSVKIQSYTTPSASFNTGMDINNTFQDPYISTTLINGSYYYLNFSVKALTSNQVFNLKLTAGNEDSVQEYMQQFIDSYKILQIPQGTEKYFTFETIIAPNATYDKILWNLQRTAQDYREAGPRKMQVQINQLQRLNNQISGKNIKKLGIQGPPSMLMCINGEPIRIGKNGIYEINNPNVNINFINFIPKNNDFFIMDYQYEEG